MNHITLCISQNHGKSEYKSKIVIVLTYYTIILPYAWLQCHTTIILLYGYVLLYCNFTPYCYIVMSYYSTGGSHLSHTVVKPDSHLAWIFFARFLCIIKLIIIIGYARLCLSQTDFHTPKHLAYVGPICIIVHLYVAILFYNIVMLHCNIIF